MHLTLFHSPPFVLLIVPPLQSARFQAGTYLLLEKLQLATYRRLIKKWVPSAYTSSLSSTLARLLSAFLNYLANAFHRLILLSGKFKPWIAPKSVAFMLINQATLEVTFCQASHPCESSCPKAEKYIYVCRNLN